MQLTWCKSDITHLKMMEHLLTVTESLKTNYCVVCVVFQKGLCTVLNTASTHCLVLHKAIQGLSTEGQKTGNKLKRIQYGSLITKHVVVKFHVMNAEFVRIGQESMKVILHLCFKFCVVRNCIKTALEALKTSNFQLC